MPRCDYVVLYTARCAENFCSLLVSGVCKDLSSPGLRTQASKLSAALSGGLELKISSATLVRVIFNGTSPDQTAFRGLGDQVANITASRYIQWCPLVPASQRTAYEANAASAAAASGDAGLQANAGVSVRIYLL